MNARSTTIIIIIILLLAWLAPSLSFALDTPATTQQRALLGQLRPPITLSDLGNRKHSLNEWQGKVLVINFWATWCTPCRDEIPMLNQLQADYGARGVQFIGVGVDTAAAIERFTKAIPIRYPVLVGGLESTQLVERYGNIAGTLPYTVFVDRTGRISTIANGALTLEFTRRVLDTMR